MISELVKGRKFGLQVFEDKLAIEEKVKGICELLGFDPLYVANEGKVVMVVGKKDANKILGIMKNHELGKDASIIGEITPEHAGTAWLQTVIGGKRIIDMLSGQQLPRIC